MEKAQSQQTSSGIAGRRDHARRRRRICAVEAERRGANAVEVDGGPWTATHTRARAHATATTRQEA
jgi:membrane protein implicated in regulation of membrane protease activity